MTDLVRDIKAQPLDHNVAEAIITCRVSIFKILTYIISFFNTYIAEVKDMMIGVSSHDFIENFDWVILNVVKTVGYGFDLFW